MPTRTNTHEGKYMITTVTLNPAIDRTIVVGKLEPGHINRAAKTIVSIGGKGINVSRSLLTLGMDTVALGFIGMRNYPEIDTLLAKDAIRADFVGVDALTRTNIKLVDRCSQTTTEINEAGFSVDRHDFEALAQKLSQYATESEYMVFSGSAPVGLAQDCYQQLISLVSPHCKVILDADHLLLREALSAHPYMIKPNIDELESCISGKLRTKEEIIAATRSLLLHNGITIGLVSMGNHGSILVTAETAYFSAPLSVRVKGTVGAGDAMLAGFLYGVSSNGIDLVEALKLSTICGTSAVCKDGTEGFCRDDFSRLSERVRITQM